MSEETEALLIIGVGNSFRGDDAVGLIVARRLREKLGWNAETVELSGEGAELMSLWQKRQLVFVIDAISSGSTPGALHWINATTERMPPDLIPVSSHLFGLSEAVEVSRAMGLLPGQLFVCGIEAASFGYGEALSPDVETAVGIAVERILREVEAALAAAL